MEISVIIVHYKTQKLTEDCLKSIYAQSENSENFDIIVVDNASQDGSAEYLEAVFPQIKMIYSPENIGFGRANNLGTKTASGKYLFFLNSDTIFLNDVLKCFVDNYKALEAEGKSPGALGCLMLDAKHQITSSYGMFESATEEILTLLKHSLRLIDLEQKFNAQTGTFAVDWIVGADIFMKKTHFEEIGKFDEKFFMYSEEVDLQKRLVIFGKTNYIIAGPSLIHLEGGSSIKKVTNSKRLMVDKSRFIYRLKHSSLPHYFFYRFCYFLLRSPSILNSNYSFRENVKYLNQLLKFKI